MQQVTDAAYELEQRDRGVAEGDDGTSDGPKEDVHGGEKLMLTASRQQGA